MIINNTILSRYIYIYIYKLAMQFWFYLRPGERNGLLYSWSCPHTCSCPPASASHLITGMYTTTQKMALQLSSDFVNSCLCVYGARRVHLTAYVQRWEDNLLESFLSFYHVGSGDQTPAVIHFLSPWQGNSKRPEYSKNILGHILLFDPILQNHLFKCFFFF